MNISVPADSTVEIIDMTEISPLISHCNIKICYVGQQPNRNGTVITKNVAKEMGRKVPGSPIVGFFNKETKDFEGHERTLEITGNDIELVDITKPYGFVPTDAMVWFQRFFDNGVEHEYLCTEGYIWTTAYPESQRIVTQGNNQSMELEENSMDGIWAKDINSDSSFFIFNEALIEKLCILGENVEPCFEGSQIKTSFSLEVDDYEAFKNMLFSMANELKETLSEGGSKANMEDINTSILEQEEAQISAGVEIEAENTFADKEKEKPEDKEKKTEGDDSDSKDEEADKKKKSEDDEDYACGDGEKKKYELEDVVEYAELKAEYDQLQNTYAALSTDYEALKEEVESLRSFRVDRERVDKQSMIDSFYMLTDEDKADVITNIDSYSLEDIEAKLSIICVRNKVNFSLEEEKENPGVTFSLNEVEDESDQGVPAWIQAVKKTESEM